MGTCRVWHGDCNFSIQLEAGWLFWLASGWVGKESKDTCTTLAHTLTVWDAG